MIWTEKYRPKQFDEVVGLPPELPSLINNDMPHLLFVGSPGIGKTTVAQIIAKQLDTNLLELNASDERGIDTVRGKIKSFSMTKSTSGKFKLVYLDEFDKLSPDAQDSLRNLMEKYSTNVRFICTGNYENKIIDAIQSRMTRFRFKVSEDEVRGRLVYILEQENESIPHEIIGKLVEVNGTDVRKSVKELQRLVMLQQVREVTLNDIGINSILPQEVHKLILKSDYPKAMKTVLDSNIEFDNFIIEYHDYINGLMENQKITPKVYKQIINVMVDTCRYIRTTIAPIIEIENFLLRMIKAVKE